MYVRLGKKNDAWQIFSAAAETLRAKGSLSGAEDVLQRMLTLDPGNSYALLAQGRTYWSPETTKARSKRCGRFPISIPIPMACATCLGIPEDGPPFRCRHIGEQLLAVHNDVPPYLFWRMP